MALWLQLEFKSLARLPLMVFDTNTVNSCGGVVHIIVPALAIPLKKGTFDLNHGRYSLSKPRDQVYSHGAKPRRPPLRSDNALPWSSSSTLQTCMLCGSPRCPLTRKCLFCGGAERTCRAGGPYWQPAPQHTRGEAPPRR